MGNGAKKLLTNADLESSHQKIVIDSMKTYHQSQQEKYKRERRLGARSANENTP
ncbi:hypothetical protein HPF23_0068 [Helicobacter pylori]|nr:hypothetical protein HPF23_0068 [Helicobacter pylori]